MKHKNRPKAPDPYRQDPSCKLCKDVPKTIQVERCKMQVGTVYTEKHNQVAGIVYRNVCAAYGPEVSGS